MIILHKLVGKKGLFYVEIDGNILAEMVYSMASPTKMIIEHTEVSDELRGKNVGYQLVETGVNFARQHNLKIIPLCTFAKSVFDKNAAFRDVLAE